MIGQTQSFGPISLGFHPKPIILTVHILKCSSRCTITVCIQLSAVKTFFFLNKNLAFAPLPLRLNGGLLTHTDRKNKRPLWLPPCPDVNRWPLSSGESSQTAFTAKDTTPQWPPCRLWAVTDDSRQGDPYAPVTLALKLGSRETLRGKTELQ